MRAVIVDRKGIEIFQQLGEPLPVDSALFALTRPDPGKAILDRPLDRIGERFAGPFRQLANFGHGGRPFDQHIQTPPPYIHLTPKIYTAGGREARFYRTRLPPPPRPKPAAAAAEPPRPPNPSTPPLGPPLRLAPGLAQRADAEHATAIGEDAAAVRLGAGVEDFDALDLGRSLEPL